MAGLALADTVFMTARAAWRPPPKKSLSEWADTSYYLSAESSAQSGRCDARRAADGRRREGLQQRRDRADAARLSRAREDHLRRRGGQGPEGTSGQHDLHKHFPGGVLSLVGANSARASAASPQGVIFDEVDATRRARADGDPIKLGDRSAPSTSGTGRSSRARRR
jgi:phage terminase large subunit GpA-like protein